MYELLLILKHDKMIHVPKLIYNPGGESGGGGTAPSDENEKENIVENPESNAGDKEHKTFMEKVREALHDWSNKDEQDQKFDDTRV